MKVLKRTVNKKKIGPVFRAEAGLITNYLSEEISTERALAMEKNLAENGVDSLKLCTGKTYEIQRNMASFEMVEEIRNGS